MIRDISHLLIGIRVTRTFDEAQKLSRPHPRWSKDLFFIRHVFSLSTLLLLMVYFPFLRHFDVNTGSKTEQWEQCSLETN